MSRKYVLGPHAARELKRLIAGTGVAERRDTVSGAIAFDSEYADPFTVQWAASANSGSGSFIIWLPSASLLIVDGKPVDLTEDLTAVGGSYPAGWYETPLSSSGGSLYLNVTPGNPESTGEEDATAEFSTSESQTEGDVSILIATAAKDALTGAVTVKQSVSSALVFGTGKGEKGASVPGPFEPVYTDGVLTALANCVYQAERYWIDCGTQSLTGITSSSDGWVVATLTHPSYSSSSWTSQNLAVSFVLTTPFNCVNGSDAQTVIPLYRVEDGKVTIDYRSVPTAVLAR